MLLDRNVNYNELIKLTSDGVSIADFVEIRNALTVRYKEIYGQDIDLSTGSADGQYVEMHSLIFNNILETIKQTYASLDVNQASGHFLDILCALSNVVRKDATSSIAQLAVKNTGSADIVLETNTKFVDKNGKTWTYLGSDITLAVNASSETSISVECDELGPVSAPGNNSGNGWITSTLTSSTIDVKQYTDAELGSYQETDAQLRARRNSSLSMSGSTVIESLQSSLLAVLGIKDALIYTNVTDTASTSISKDGTSIQPHSIYVIVRQRKEVTVSNETIGLLIYNKLTPGINTSPTGVSADNKNYTVAVTDILRQTISWRQSTPVTPTISIGIALLPGFDKNTTYSKIIKAICDYCNEKRLSENLTANELWAEATYADPLFRGKATFSVGNVTINNAASYTNLDTYYDYHPTSAMWQEYPTLGGITAEIIISG